MFDYLEYLAERIGDFFANLFYFVVGGLGDGGAPGPKGRTAVPNVRGMDVEEARHALSREGFKVEILRLEERPAPVMGMVVDQDPAPGRRRHRGLSVRIDVAHPRQPQTQTR
jgi:PASTA domain